MDTSETYIKMADCKEIQNIGEKKDADWDEDLLWWVIQVERWCPKCKSYERGTYCSECRTKVINKEEGYLDSVKRVGLKSIWLPRQDEIQEMAERVDPRIEINIANFLEILPFCDTWEKFWLAFYMHEKHSKKWSSEKECWIKKK